MIFGMGAMALIVLAWLFALQVSLALGAPIGALAWGGAHKKLPKRLRIASLFSALLMVFIAVCVGQLAQFWDLSVAPNIAKWVLYIFGGLMVLSFFANLLSQSKIERITGGICAAILAVSLPFIAYSA